ncbi:MAG: hypothetical protein IPI48_04645 [bacterium]|nr:hypothetical protein [bacterium]
MKFLRCLVVITLTTGLSAAAVAAGDPQPAAPIPATQAGTPAVTPTLVPDPTAGLADLPENQAELEAIRSGELKLVQPEGVAPTPAVSAARDARRAAFDAVINEQNAQVQVLTDRLEGADNEAALAIQKEIELTKKAAQRRLLEVQLEMATTAGDQAGIERLQAALAAWDAPIPVGQPVDRPVPTNPGR